MTTLHLYIGNDYVRIEQDGVPAPVIMDVNEGTGGSAADMIEAYMTEYRPEVTVIRHNEI